MKTPIASKKNYLVPFLSMVVLMALIGLITNINQQFQAPLQEIFLSKAGSIKNTLATLNNFAFFTAYLVMGFSAARSLERSGYRTTLLKGLWIMCLSFIIVELSAWQFDKYATMFHFGAVQIPLAFGIFIAGSFISGTALTYLQAAVNPYLVLCELPDTSSVQRQTIAACGNSTMTTIGPLLVAYLIFRHQSADTIHITSLYIPFGMLILLVGGIIILLQNIHLPDAKADDLSSETNTKTSGSVWQFSHLALGVVAIFLYVGDEVSVGSNINLYAISLGASMEHAANLASMYWGGMLVGLLCGSFISKVPPQRQLAFTTICAVLFILSAIIFNNPFLLVFVGLCHSVMWPSIFALAIRGLGAYTAKGSGALMMGVFGGAVLPFTQSVLADVLGRWNITFFIVIIGELYLFYYATKGHVINSPQGAQGFTQSTQENNIVD